MRRCILLKMGAVGATFRVGPRRHQGRHRCSPMSRRERRLGSTNVMPGEPLRPAADQMNQGTAPQDFYVVFPNVPSSPSSLGS
jgi:hypothetical protein